MTDAEIELALHDQPVPPQRPVLFGIGLLGLVPSEACAQFQWGTPPGRIEVRTGKIAHAGGLPASITHTTFGNGLGRGPGVTEIQVAGPTSKFLASRLEAHSAFSLFFLAQSFEADGMMLVALRELLLPYVAKAMWVSTSRTVYEDELVTLVREKAARDEHFRSLLSKYASSVILLRRNGQHGRGLDAELGL